MTVDVRPIALILALALAVGSSACESAGEGSDAGASDGIGAGDAGAVGPASPRVAYHEHEFRLDPTLRANPDDVIVLSLERPGVPLDGPGAEVGAENDSARRGIDEIPYEIRAPGLHRICGLDQHGDPHRIELVDEGTGSVVASLRMHRPHSGLVHPTAGCTTVALRRGFYTLRVTHAGGAQVSPRDSGAETLFVQPVAADATQDDGKADETTITQLHVIEDSCEQCDLTGIDLRGHTLDYVQLDGANLSGADLSGAHIGTEVLRSWTHAVDGAIDREVYSSNLQSVHFDGANLTATTFNHVDLTNAWFTDVRLDRTNFFNCSLQHGQFSSTTFAATQISDSDVCAGEFPVGKPPQADPSVAATTLAGSIVPFELLPISLWHRFDFRDATIIASNEMAGTVFDGLDLSQTSWIVAPGTNYSNTSWVGTGARLGQGVEADLTRANFTGANLSKLDFTSVHMPDATLDRANLTEAILTSATLSGVTAAYADFSRANLDNTYFDTGGTTSLYGATFVGANLSSVHMSNVDLSYGEFYGSTTTLTGANFVGATLVGANFAYADLTGVLMNGASLGGTSFIAANLTDTKFLSQQSRPATLSRAYFCGATLTRTDFSGAVLSGASFPTTQQLVPGAGGTQVTCSPVDTSQAKTSAQTVCPNGSHPSDGIGCKGAEWAPPVEPEPPCCTPQSGQFCPHRLPAGELCDDRCDCKSYACAATAQGDLVCID